MATIFTLLDSDLPDPEPVEVSPITEAASTAAAKLISSSAFNSLTHITESTNSICDSFTARDAFVAAAGPRLTLPDTGLGLIGSSAGFGSLSVINEAMDRFCSSYTITDRIAEAVDSLVPKMPKLGVIGSLVGFPTQSTFAAAGTRIFDNFTATENFMKTAGQRLNFLPDTVATIGSSIGVGSLSRINEAMDRFHDNLAITGRIAEAVGSLAPKMPSLELPLFKVFRMREFEAWQLLSAGMLDQLSSINRWVRRLGASIVWEARAALAAYERGDARPMLLFIANHLRLRPPTHDHAQALALALWEGSWEQTVDLQDERSVLLALGRHAREGDYEEWRHEVAGKKIGRLDMEALSAWRTREPGPEALAIAAVTPWEEQFQTPGVRYAANRLKEDERAVARAWAENHPIPWTRAPELVEQEPKMGERVRLKLHRLGEDFNARTQARFLGEGA